MTRRSMWHNCVYGCVMILWMIISFHTLRNWFDVDQNWFDNVLNWFDVFWIWFDIVRIWFDLVENWFNVERIWTDVVQIWFDFLWFCPDIWWIWFELLWIWCDAWPIWITNGVDWIWGGRLQHVLFVVNLMCALLVTASCSHFPKTSRYTLLEMIKIARPEVLWYCHPTPARLHS